MRRRDFLGVAILGLTSWAVGRAEVPTVTSGNTAFALDLHRQLQSRPGNQFVSPLSISAALAMTQAGARGPTLAEMARVLHLPGDEATHRDFGQLLRDLQASRPNSTYQLLIANALWGQTGTPFRPEYLDLTRKQYAGGFRQVDFAAGDKARNTINAWIAEQTRDKIKDVLKPGSPVPETKLVLTNAIYFKDAWQHPFAKGATRDEPFFTASGEARMPLMVLRKSFNYFADDLLQAVELPYKGGQLSMIVLLPRANDGLAKLEAELNPANLTRWVALMKHEEGLVRLPKFTIRDRVDLGETLQKMGMKLAFSDDADFTGMSASERLKISQVIHQTFVAVDEEGTEAAAATVVEMKPLAAPIPREPFQFRADHPFVFLIRDRKSGSVLFLGRFTGPAE